MTKRKSERGPLIERTTDDPNFAHTLSLLGACAAFAESLKPGQRVSWNDLNAIQIPVEIALAFAKERLGEQSQIGEAAHKAFEVFAMLRSLHAGAEQVQTATAENKVQQKQQLELEG